MAELRDRYRGHGFDDDGNDNNMKTFEKATKQLLEFSQKFSRDYQNQLKATKEEYAENLRATKDLLKDIKETSGIRQAGQVIGSSTRSSLANAASTATQAIVGGAGPLGYILEKTLNLSGGVRALVENFGTGGGSHRVSSKGGEPVSEEKAKKASKAAFESYPTIVKLRAWLNYQTKDNPLFRKYMLVMQQRAKEQGQYEKEQKKEQTQMKKLFQKMKENSDKDAMRTSLIVAGVVAGVAAIVGIGMWVKSIYDKRFGSKENTTMQAPTKKVGSQFVSGDYAGQQKVTSPYGKRSPVVDSSGRVVSGGGTHYGVDIATPKGSPVKSLTPGKAYARMQTKSGFKAYKQAKNRNDLEPLAGYGIFVDVICLPSTAERLGFAGRRVTIRYAHLSGTSVSPKGTKVITGQIIGFSGQTGAASGPHVHIEVLVDGRQVPANSIGKQWAVGSSGNWEREYTVNPEQLKFFDKGGRVTTAAGAYMSWSSQSGKEYVKRKHAVEASKKITTKKTSTSPWSGGLEFSSGRTTGQAANIELSGKNDALLGTNNLSYRTTATTTATTTGRGYTGSLPALTQALSAFQAQQTQQKQTEPSVQLNFDIQNSATKALKQADKSIDFIKV